jgi:NADPH2:quinone reductase
MKAAVLHKIGEAPKYEDVPDPKSSSDQEMVIHVKAAAIKNIEKMIASGSHYDSVDHLPMVMGFDGVGVTEDGRRVLAGSPQGMMAEKAVVPKAFVVPVPDELDDATAAALLNAGLSAWFGLSWRAKVKQGDSVLIMGATGVAGKMAVQLARYFGATYVAAAGRDPEALQRLSELGADEVISLAQPDDVLKAAFTNLAQKHPLDAVLDFIWGHPAEVLLDALTGHDLDAEAHVTRYVQIGEMAGARISLAAATLRSAGIELYGQGGGSVPKEEMGKLLTDVIPTLIELAVQGKIKVDTEVVPLRDVEQAWSRSDLHGKRIVLVP